MSNLAKRIRSSYDQVFQLRDEATGEAIAPIFNVMPDKKLYPDYYDIITTPTSLNSIKKRLNTYTSPNEFIRDLAQIVWNAMTYNEKDSFVYKYATILDHFINLTTIPKFRKLGYDVHYPNLGASADTLKLNPTANSSSAATPQPRDDDEYQEQESAHLPERKKRSTITSYSKEQSYKRGRPPVIDKPFEQRIKNVLRNLKREKGSAGDALYLPFDKLPDIREYPDYYKAISNPISLDEIRKKVKQRKYRDVAAFAADVKIMFDNAKYYNDDSSKLYKDAVKLERAFEKLVEIEVKKPDSDYLPTDSLKIPLDQLELHGSLFKIGDWILINNPNDPSKPIVAQLFRIWQTQDGQRWINVCWYLRPEQTVHRVDRLFYENEVFKSGQYRDHLADEVVGKCYVAYFTRYQRGDPAIPYEGPLFICEYRYNDNDKNFNKIRTWKACLPDEVRDHEDPINPLPSLRIFKKYESPLKHLLPANATITMPIPEPTIGAPNAPPLHGAVYLRDIDETDDLGQYTSSRVCPKYIIRPNDPQPSKTPSTVSTPTLTYNKNSYPANTKTNLYHAIPTYVPASTASSFTIPLSVTNGSEGLIKMDISNNKRRLAGISNDVNTEGPIIWFRTPGVNISSRVAPALPFEDINKIMKKRKMNDLKKQGKLDSDKLDDELDDDEDEDDYDESPGDGIAGPLTPGHSVQYLAWKLSQQS